MRASLDVFDLHGDDVLYGMLPPFHSFGFTVTGLMPLLTGARVAYTPDPTDSQRLARGIKKWGITVIASAPTFLKGILSALNPENAMTLRHIVSGAEKAPPELERQINRLGLQIKMSEGYGITECSPVVTMNVHGTDTKGVGKPIPGVSLCIVNPEKHEVLATGQEGMVLAYGPSIFAGYLNSNGVAAPFLWIHNQQWYQTGDLGYLDEEGNLYLSGRLKRFVKVGAEMISLGGIEEALLQVALEYEWPLAEGGPSLAVCATEVAGEKPKVYLFTSFDLTVDEANKALRKAGFSNLVKITETRKMGSIPVMGTGKINYRKLEEELK